MDRNAAKTVYGMINPNRLVGYNQGVSVDKNGKWNAATGTWSANNREMVWNPKYNSWVITKGDPSPCSHDVDAEKFFRLLRCHRIGSRYLPQVEQLLSRF